MKSIPAASALLLFTAGSVLAGCGGGDDTNASGGSAGNTGTAGSQDGGTGGGGASGGGGSGGTTQPQPQYVKTMSGDATWQVTFDDIAKMAGATDCTYTRHYEAVEDRSAPWLCPACEIMFRADVTLTDGLQTCYNQVSMFPPSQQEWLGYGNGQWWRSAEGPTVQQGTATVDAMNVTTANMVMDLDAPVGGKMGFVVSGQLTLGEQEGDPLNGFIPPDTYACGWPKANPPPYTGDWVLAQNALLPDGLFHDSCNETVRLHDFAGAYLVVDMSAIDCPPCQAMASEEEQFVTDMAAKGVEVRVITLLAPSLDDVFGLTTKTLLDNWSGQFGLTSAVLADRGWGVAEFLPVFGVDNLGYPSWVVVRPDLTVVDFANGYGSWADMEAIIDADMP